VSRNFLLGKGERLVTDVVVRGGGGPKEAPYTFTQARGRLLPKLVKATRQIDQLPDKACPNDKAVVALTLNPEYLSKSAYPHDLLRAVGLQAVGSKPKQVLPERKSRGREPTLAMTTQLFVAGKRSVLRLWGQSLTDWNEGTEGAKELAAIEDIVAPSSDDKIKGIIAPAEKEVFEAVLHADELEGESFVLPQFREYLEFLEIEPALHKRFYAGGLCFLELVAPSNAAQQIAAFAPLRVLREMPQLRMLRPTIRSAGVPSQQLILPSQPALDPSIKVAIFDGGIPSNHPINQWATGIEGNGVTAAQPEYLKHGVNVTSALLFGHLEPGQPAPQPYANVDHHRVLDDAPGQNPMELYEVLDRIDHVISNETYDFINLSLGPQLPVEDDDVHAWTAVLDDRLGRADTLATIAVGNDGESDATLGLNRIQVPADCVNALAVGSCNTPDQQWERAPYSSVGPGRSPGLIKPDLVEFGGSIGRPFLVVSESGTPVLDATGGTSFAAPSVLRLGTGIRAHFGSSINLLATRTLLIHQTEKNDDVPREEIGWGRVARNLDELVFTDDDTIRVIYQGKISPAKYIRMPIPIPDEEIAGYVNISATLCYKSLTDPHHPGNYTRAGLEVAFRPHDGKYKNDTQLHPDTKSFFGTTQKGMNEDELRRDAWKWENCLHAAKRFRGTSLLNPVFDIHYNARLEGTDFRPDNPLSYAMVISVSAKNSPDLYNQVVRKYATQLEQLRPSIEIPLQT
jgi:hypothetical protein